MTPEDRATLERVERLLTDVTTSSQMRALDWMRTNEARELVLRLLAEGEESREPEDPGPLNMPREVRRRGRVVWNDPGGGS
jgi:hypothetical protein